MKYKLEHTDCTLCGKNNTELLIEVKSKYTPDDIYKMVRCKHCDLVYVNPRIHHKDLRVAYRDDANALEYYANLWDSREKYASEVFYKTIDYYYKDPRRDSIIDIGAGTGAMLEPAVKNGFKNIYGTEINKYVVEYANKTHPEFKLFPIDICSPGEMECLPKNFDVVITHHTLEHVWDAMAALVNINNLLKPGGLLIASVPNMSSHLANFAAYNEDKISELFDPTAHVYQFTEITLAKLAAKAGFIIIALNPPLMKVKLKSKLKSLLGYLRLRITDEEVFLVARKL